MDKELLRECVHVVQFETAYYSVLDYLFRFITIERDHMIDPELLKHLTDLIAVGEHQHDELDSAFVSF
jgi:hypothetical protein